MSEAQRHIVIENRKIGVGFRPFIIAEIAQAHDGSLGLAHSYIEAAKRAGADAVKFQTHIADAESTLDENFRVKFSLQDQTRYAYWKRMEFSAEQWAGLAAHAKDEGLVFLSSAFSCRAVELLRKIGVGAWKVGSGEFRSYDVVDKMTESGLPILLSTGMSTFDDIDAVLPAVSANRGGYAIFQCTSKYPTAFADVGLNVIEELKLRYGCPVGLSDHSGSIWPAVAALAQGANLLEVHICFDKNMFGPDTLASVTVGDMRLICEARDAIYAMGASPVDKSSLDDEASRMRELFSKSLAPLRLIEKGATLSADMLTAKKPGTGIPVGDVKLVVGRRLRNAVHPDRLLRWDDIEPLRGDG